MAPIVHGLEVEYFGKVKFAYLDVDDPANDEFKKALGYRVQPHFFLLDGDGNIVNCVQSPVSILVCQGYFFCL